jgi:hypothetical protein
MRSLGYLIVEGDKRLVLYEDKNNSRLLKLRKSGKDGTYLPDESKHVTLFIEKYLELLSGKTIEV